MLAFNIPAIVITYELDFLSSILPTLYTVVSNRDLNPTCALILIPSLIFNAFEQLTMPFERLAIDIVREMGYRG